jgi:electron transfer flavoprotein beta subunit
VFIKQVPDTNDVKWTQNNNIDRTKMDSILNPVDKQAIQAALNLKEQYGVHTTAVTMGPNKSIEVLKEAVAMGIDDAALLCDPQFAGSDTCATSRVLSAAIKEKFPDTDLILFGQSAIDGETSQTGPSTAARLEMPFACHVNEIVELKEDVITVKTENETEKNMYNIKLPAVLCINNYVFLPELPRINGYIKAHDYNYKTYNIFELRIKAGLTGVKGSPTFVHSVYKTEEHRNCNIINTAENKEYAYDVIKQIKETMEQ